MSKCATCGYDPSKLQQKRAGLALWAGMKPLERKIEMARRRQVGRERKLNPSKISMEELIEAARNRQ